MGNIIPMAKKKKQEITIRSSAAEYLTYISAIGDQPSSVELHYEDENIWLTQRLLAELYGVSVPAISQHIKQIYKDNELEETATIKKYLIVQNEGNRQIAREVIHYNLQMIIAVGFKVNNERAVQFRKWANTIVKDFTIQGWVMDEERLKNGGTILTKDYFEKQLEKVREIRLSERRFYQKITDIYATSIDYDPTSEVLQDAGKISAELAKAKAETEFEKYRIVQDRLYMSDFDRFLQLEEKTKA